MVCDVNIRVKNIGDRTHIRFEIGGYDPINSYAKVAPGSFTEYRQLQSCERSDVFFLSTLQDTLSDVGDYTRKYLNMANVFYTVEEGMGTSTAINFSQD